MKPMAVDRRRVLRLVASASVVACAGCAQPKSTRLAVQDFQDMGVEVGAALQASLVSGFLAERNANSEPMVIGIQRVVNYTRDLLSEGERWYLMSKVRDSMQRGLQREKNVVFVIAADKLEEARRVGAVEDAFAQRAPTHAMTGKIRSVTRETGGQRADAYLFECDITDLKDGSLVWTGSAELKRWASGQQWD